MINHSSDNLTPSQILQPIYHKINSSDDNTWIRHGLRSILYLKNKGFEFITSCDIWDCLDGMKLYPINPRSMGLVVKLAHKNGLLQRTDNYKPSRRKQANQRPVRIWRLI